MFLPFQECNFAKGTTYRLTNCRDKTNMKTLVRQAADLSHVPLDIVDDVWFTALEDRDETDLSSMTESFVYYMRVGE